MREKLFSFILILNMTYLCEFSYDDAIYHCAQKHGRTHHIYKDALWYGYDDVLEDSP